MVEKRTRNGFWGKVFGFFFAILGLFGMNLVVLNAPMEAYAEPTTQEIEVQDEDDTNGNNENENNGNANNANNGNTNGENNGDANGNNENSNGETTEGEDENDDEEKPDGCQDALGSIGWIVCPTTGKIAQATDWLYDRLEGILTINPVQMKDGEPIYEIWKYARGITNIVFIIFLLIVIYSQITGIGISNYGIKKVLPKLIVVAILVNLSFIICSLAVDASNILGNGLRGVFATVQESAAANMTTEGMVISQTSMWTAISGGTALAIGGAVVAFETGAIWMLIPVALGAIVAVASGLITVAMRQAVVVLLIMIAPLAIVCYMLPNTEHLFQKWKKLFIQMLIFFPMFSLLFGASQLAGFAIISSAKDGFMVMLGVAVEIFPLFFSWKLMKMSGTMLGTINAKIQGLAAKPLAASRAMANSQRALTRMNTLARERPITPSARLMQYMNKRQIAREAEISEKSELVKQRGLAYRASLNYDENGVPTKQGEAEYKETARSLEYQRIIAQDKNNMNKGLGLLKAVDEHASDATKARLNALDNRIVNASDFLKVEQARGERIEYENAEGFHRRMDEAMDAHIDEMYGYEVDDAGRRTNVRASNYKRHFEPGSDKQRGALARYGEMSRIMEGKALDVQYAAATAARAYSTQQKVQDTAFQNYFALKPATADVENRLKELTTVPGASGRIDEIISGLRVLNQRGDTDIVQRQMENLLDTSKGGGVELGTHASQSLASFLMFDVKDSDPWLRRFGKYINLETAHVYNKNERKKMNFDYSEYVNGYYYEDGATTPTYVKKGMTQLMEGTGIDGIERTALSNFDDSIKRVYTEGEHLDVDAYLAKRQEIQNAIAPQFVSASLKYLSGSEQLKSAVKFLTGYSEEIKTNSAGERVSVWTPAWDENGKYSNAKGYTAEDREKLRAYFNGKTLEYLNMQTPSQILGLRSDYKDPLKAHLVDAYKNEKEENVANWSEEAQEEWREYMAEYADIQTRYGDLPPDEAQRKREQDIRELENKTVGAKFRQLLDQKGKLNQIYRTRRSGAANNAKDWVREWLNLDDETEINKKLNKDRTKVKRDEGDDGSTSDGGRRIYTDDDRAVFTSYVDDLWQSLRAEDDETFYEESIKYIRSVLGRDSVIEKEYEQFHKDDPYADSHMLKEYLNSLLSDESKY